ncbi:hypothetical protein [Actinomadura sp. 9N215]|uniref:hypothetical protein n=1 Tax=Actinomadura sp. 9N215 TaxID=3375150 RepID=UPI0037AC1DDA
MAETPEDPSRGDDAQTEHPSSGDRKWSKGEAACQVAQLLLQAAMVGMTVWNTLH